MCGAIDQGVIGTLIGCCYHAIVLVFQQVVEASVYKHRGTHLYGTYVGISTDPTCFIALEVRLHAPLTAVEVRG